MASKLISRLQGPARLLAMSWNRGEFDTDGGTLIFLRKLASSPLVRRSLPNAAAILQQYLGFKRKPGESMSSFLVRETLGFEEFAEALLRLWEEKNGVDQSQSNFGLPPVEDPWESWWWDEPEPDAPPDPNDYPEVPSDRVVAMDTAEGEAREEAAPRADAESRPVTPPPRLTVQASAGSSPSHPSVHGRGPPSLRAVSVQAPSQAASPELSVTDSFIMGVLRGWRLLQAASLSAEETRDILSTTHNKLDFEEISAALQVLWDDQLLGPRYPSSSFHGRQAQHNLHWQQLEEWPGDWDWHDAEWWEDAQWHEEEWTEDWPEETAEATLAPVEEEPDDQVIEAQQAEQQAEQLALEARRTWLDAQRTTQQVRRDRGFGKPSTKPGACFNCGGNHFQRDCPDLRVAPYKGKGSGKGKFSNYVEYPENYQVNYVQSKGKGKGKSAGKFPSKQAHMVHDMNWAYRGKGKGKPSNAQASRPPVNAYSTQYDFSGLEMSTADLASASQESSLQPSFGMLDCGATASAAPDASVQGLIKAILQQDKGARIDVQPYMRPHFRFGNGKWGQALYRVVITSDVSGQSRRFSLFSLPNPVEMSPKNLVPVLIGMDHIGPQGCQMIVDFCLGYIIDGVDITPEIYQLSTNSKGHFVYDIVNHLTKGKTSSTGSARVHVDRDVHNLSSATLQFRPLEFYHAKVEREEACAHDVETRKKLLWKLHAHVKAAEAHSAHMCSSRATELPDDIPFRDRLRNGIEGAFDSPDFQGGERHAGLHREPQGEARKESVPTSGQKQGNSDGSSRSQSSEHLAMLRSSCGKQLAEQPLRTLAPLCNMQRKNGLCPKEGCTEQLDSIHESRDGSQDAPGAGTLDARCSTFGKDLQGHDGQDPSRCAAGDFASGSHQAELQGAQVQSRSKGEKFSQEGRRVQFAEDFSKSSQLGTPADRSARAGQFALGGGEDKAHGDPQGEKDGHVESQLGADHGVKTSLKSSMSVPRSTDGDLSTTLNPSMASDGTSSLRTSSKGGSNIKPLPKHVAGKVMQFAALMTSALMSVALDISLEGREGLWEIACSENSWLTASAQSHGITARRINYANGYDIYQKETWTRLAQERRVRRPKKLWLSLPCTKWCQWTQVNYNTPERRDALETMRRRERRMLRDATWFLKDAVDDDPDIDIYFEWTFPCSGWQQTPMVEFEEALKQRGVPWESCRVDGCNYGMMDKDGKNFLHKKWLIKTTDELFHKNFRAKVCPRNHQHSLIQGLETSRSAYYPKRMVESIVRHWKRQLAPHRHLHLLSGDSKHAPVEDENWERRCKHGHPELHACSLKPPAGQELSVFPAEEVVHVDDDDQQPPGEPDDSVLTDVSQADKDKWEARLRHYHRAAGHPTNKNLIHLFRDAGLEPWKIVMAKQFKCDACESVKLGGSSSGRVPPAATPLSLRN